MSGHTKGPWIHDGDGWITAESGESVVDYAGCGSHEADWRNPSDLQLALAAPDLLEALELMCAEFRALDLPYGSQAYAAAISAINKARSTS